jgi:hypothetical protein
VGATVPALTRLAWGLLAVGVDLLLIGVLAIVLAARRRPTVPPAPYAVAPAGPPPSWSPPTPVDRTTAADARQETPTSTPPPSPPPA